MKQLPSVTLIIVDCVDALGAIDVLERCKADFEFGAVKLLTDAQVDYPHRVEIPALKTLVAYSVFMLTKCHEYVDTQHMLVVQRDGFIINPHKWDDTWLEYDYIGPMFDEQDVVGSGGFSFRSNALMKAVSKKMPEWDWTQEGADAIQDGPSRNHYEDGAICMKFREYLINSGFKFAPPNEASVFAQGRNKNHYYDEPFGFHRGFPGFDLGTNKKIPKA